MFSALLFLSLFVFVLVEGAALDPSQLQNVDMGELNTLFQSMTKEELVRFSILSVQTIAAEKASQANSRAMVVYRNKEVRKPEDLSDSTTDVLLAIVQKLANEATNGEKEEIIKQYIDAARPLVALVVKQIFDWFNKPAAPASYHGFNVGGSLQVQG